MKMSSKKEDIYKESNNNKDITRFKLQMPVGKRLVKCPNTFPMQSNFMLLNAPV